MGAAGPNHFMTTLNCYCAGGYSVAVFDEYTGAKLSPNNTTLSDFFSVTVPSGPYAGTYPTSAGDPYLLYDHWSQRWIATSIDTGSWHILLAVSNGPDPVGSGGPNWVSNNWKKYLVPFGPCQTDHPTLGVDGNGIYICSDLDSCSGYTSAKVAALPKAQSARINWGRVNNGTSMAGPVRYFAGKDCFESPIFGTARIGDYSWTTLDPDGLTIWTIQEYAELRTISSQLQRAFGTRIAAFTPF